jgi:hypothetical protein
LFEVINETSLYRQHHYFLNGILRAIKTHGFMAALTQFLVVGRIKRFLVVSLILGSFLKVAESAETEVVLSAEEESSSPELSKYSDDKEGRVIFDRGNEEDLRDCEKIVGMTTGCFHKITGQKTGDTPIRIFLTDHLSRGNVSLVKGVPQGITFCADDGFIIQISNQRSSSFGRVLAHETTHVLLREAYGQTINLALTEGLAEYIAQQSYPSEVQRQMSAAATGGLTRVMRPYVEGYRFISRHAHDPAFAEFFAVEIKVPCDSGRDLEKHWKEWISHKPVSKQESKVASN